MKLLVSQKDQLFDIIEKEGLSPSQFEFTENASLISHRQVATSLKYINTDYFFSFETGPNSETSHYAIYCPGIDIYKQSNISVDWPYQLHCFQAWLSALSRELTAPNKWERLKKEIAEIKISFKDEGGKFSVHEFEDLMKKISPNADKIQ